MLQASASTTAIYKNNLFQNLMMKITRPLLLTSIGSCKRNRKCPISEQNIWVWNSKTFTKLESTLMPGLSRNKASSIRENKIYITGNLYYRFFQGMDLWTRVCRSEIFGTSDGLLLVSLFLGQATFDLVIPFSRRRSKIVNLRLLQ